MRIMRALALLALLGACSGGGGGGGGSSTPTPTTPPPANQAPTASFTYEVDNATRSVSFNASASRDSDGTIDRYAWNFGDGNTGSGVTTSHTYTEEGEYTVTLTVTDDDGATGRTTATVTVTNEPPNASFNFEVNDLSVSVDARPGRMTQTAPLNATPGTSETKQRLSA